jgi:hypothetical protein
MKQNICSWQRTWGDFAVSSGNEPRCWYLGATADSASARERSPCRDGYDYAAPFNPNSAIRARAKRIAVPSASNGGGVSRPCYRLRSGSQRPALRRPFVHRIHQPALHHSGLQKNPDQLQQPLLAHPFCNLCHQSVVIDRSNISHPPTVFRDRQGTLFGVRSKAMSTRNAWACLSSASCMMRNTKRAELLRHNPVPLVPG